MALGSAMNKRNKLAQLCRYINTGDVAIGRRLSDSPALREVDFTGNRRVLDVEKISQDCQLGKALFGQVTRPQVVDGRRALA